VLVEPADGQWAARDQPFVLRIDEPPAAPERLAIFIGSNDLTGLCDPQGSGELRCSPALLPMPEGEQEIVVYLVRSATEWQETARVPVRVLTPGGLEVSEVAPRLDLNQAFEVDRGGSADPSAPAAGPTSPDADVNALTGQAGIATRWRRSGWELRSAWNVMGTSLQAKTLRYATLGEEAPEVDLIDYLVELEHGGTQLAIGHVSHGDHALLLNGLSHRGLSFHQRVGSRMDIGITAQSGQILSGYSDMLGVNSDNYIAGASAGFELLGNRPGGLRLSLMYLKAETRSQLDFNTGQVPDAQDNSGYDVRLTGCTPGNRWRGSLEFALSRYTNPDDPLLSQGLDVVPVTEETSKARDLDVAWDLVQNRQLGADTYAGVTLGYRYQRSDPLYRTVGALMMADQESHTGTLSASIGGFSFQALQSNSEDNVDDVPTVLKTRTRTTTLGYGLLLRSLFPSPAGGTRAWLPDSVSQTYARMHQQGVNRPPSFDPSTHIPDQVTQILTTGLNWSFQRAALGYQFTLGDLDNRQPAREEADFQNITHGISLGLQVASTLRIGLGLNAASAANREEALKQYIDGYNLDLDWQSVRNLGFRGSYTLTEADDSRQLGDSRSWTTLTEINYRIALPMSRAHRFPIQFYLRHVNLVNDQAYRPVGFSSHARTWSISGGLNVGWL
jgi:hypothetical protein